MIEVQANMDIDTESEEVLNGAQTALDRFLDISFPPDQNMGCPTLGVAQPDPSNIIDYSVLRRFRHRPDFPFM
jgi:hypothetical protein